MRTTFLAFALLATASVAHAAPQSRDPSINPPPAEPCFEVDHVTRYHSDGDRALIVRTDTDRYYRIGFAAQCPNALRKDAALVLKARGGGSSICKPVDLRLTLTASAYPQTCAVDSIQPMTADQVAALPARNRP